MSEPVLLIMAAGMGSRYGGLKQMESIGSSGELILDFSLYDAWRAGFKKAIFIIKREIEEDFRTLVEGRASRFIETQYAFQELSDLPKDYEVPQGRTKPWGTAHAVLTTRHLVDGPFAVINADDFYGADGFRKMHDFLVSNEDVRGCGMIGYHIDHTLTENGHVARGLCDVSEDGLLLDIVERTNITQHNGEIMFTEDDGKTWEKIPGGTVVSMNFWGFPKGVMQKLHEGFPAFLDKTLAEDPLKGEFFLPIAVSQMLSEKEASVTVLMSEDKWYGVTYKEDKAAVVAAIQGMQAQGIYPEKLWESR